MCLKKAEKGINLEDFMFMSRLFEFGHIQDGYYGNEKYKHYFAAFFMVYFNYHKDLKVEEMDSYYLKKFDSRKVNKSDRFNMLKACLKNKLPYTGFHSIMKTNYPSLME